MSSLGEPKIVRVAGLTAPMVAAPEAMLSPKTAVRSGSLLPPLPRMLMVNDALVSVGPKRHDARGWG